MTNYVAFLCSIFLLIVLLSNTDGLWNDQGWNNERWNAERRNDGRWNNERSNDDRWNNERSNDESRYDDRWDDKRSNDERWNNERSYDDRRNGERLNDGRRNDERRNNERRKDEISNDDRRNNEGWNDERSNDERRNNERSNDEKRNNERSDDKRRNNEKSNDERRDNERSDGNRRNNESSNKSRNDERRNDVRRNGDRKEEADKCPADKKEDWSYRGNNGPLMWNRRYPECGGRAQSPVAINSYEVDLDADIKKLKFDNYQIPVERATIENNGHTIQMTPRDDVQRVIHFDSRTYRLDQVHFHWGDDKSHGSEHTINSIHYALEMHLVHQSANGRTAVVAVFFKEQSQASKELQNIIQNFPKLMYKDNSTELKTSININNLLPENPATYYMYEGSLTTPPCTEGVQWMLLRKIMPVGTKQMAEFRKLYSSSKADSNEHCTISNNYRPLQSLNGRIVVISQ